MPRTFRYSRPKIAPSETLCEYLAKKFSYFTVAEWEQQIRNGYLSINDSKVPTQNPAYELQQQDVIIYAPPPAREPSVDLQHLEILYSDADIMVCVKNGNLPVTEGGRYCENTLCSFLNRGGAESLMWKTRSNSARVVMMETQSAISIDATDSACTSSLSVDQLPVRSHNQHVSSHKKYPDDCTPCKRPRIEEERNHSTDNHSSPMEGSSGWTGLSALTFYPIHRLDKETSGLLVMGRSIPMTQRLSLLFEAQSKHLTESVERRLGVSEPRGVELHPASVSVPIEGCDGNTVPCPSSSSSSLLPSLTNADFEMLKSDAQKQVEKHYVAVLSGEAVAGAVHVVVTRIGTMAEDPNWKGNPEHQKLLKLKMVCYPASNSRGGQENPVGLTTSNPSNTHIRQDVDGELSSDAMRQVSAAVDVTPSMKKDIKMERGKIAVSRITILNVDKVLHISLARVEILTGRTHQIRLHCAHIGFPVLGDKLYSCKNPGVYGGSYAVPDQVYFERVRNANPFVQDPIVPSLLCQRHLLHAAKLVFPHPNPLLNGKTLQCVANPVDWFLLDVKKSGDSAQEDTLPRFQAFLEESLD